MGFFSAKSGVGGRTKRRLGVRLGRFLMPVGLGLLLFASGYYLGNGDITLSRILTPSNSQNKDLPENLDYSSVEQVYDSLRDNFAGDLDADKLIEGLKDGLAAATGDAYTEFFNEEEADEFDESLSGTFSGIGAELGKEEESIVVVAPIKGFPAEKAGLKPGDIIAKINDESAFNLTINEAVKKIRGPKGTTVKLTVIRDRAKELDFEITREEIKIPSVEYEIKEGNIGYIKITRFGDDTVQLTRQAAEKFKNAGVKGVILDMRSNPGGLLDAAVGISSLWLDSGKTVLEERRGEEVIKTYRAQGQTTLKGVPTVVLIDGGSASASEITAGALHDHSVAMLIGTKTYGKGSVQRLIDFNNGTQLKVTIARWFTPDGKNIDQEGIEPDQTVEVTDEDIEAKFDSQLEAAIKELE